MKKSCIPRTVLIGGLIGLALTNAWAKYEFKRLDADIAYIKKELASEPIGTAVIVEADKPMEPEEKAPDAESGDEAYYPLTEAERDIVERVVTAEAGGEDFDGKALVAQCILNTALARDMSPKEVVTEKNQYAKPKEKANEQAKEAVSAVFDGGYQVTKEPVRYFYSKKYCNGAWHEKSLTFVLEHGGHRFFKE